MPAINSPCKNCPKKGCGSYHDECPEFKEFKAKSDNYKQRKLTWDGATINRYEIEKSRKRRNKKK